MNKSFFDSRRVGGSSVDLAEGHVLPVTQLDVPMPKVVPLRQSAPETPSKDDRK